MRLLLATRSADKAREIRAILPQRWTLVSLDEAGIPAHPDEDAIEVFDTFRENAAAKARYFSGLAGMPTLADDSGLAVSALDGAPGVRSKRFAQDRHAEFALPGDDDVDARNNALLLHLLEGRPPEQRAAAYVCAAVAVFPGADLQAAIGTCPGRILAAPRGTGGFGYDPIFEPDGYLESFGELPAEVKNALSHRGRAFRALAVAISLRPSIDPHQAAD